jgi:hypothetical protein
MQLAAQSSIAVIWLSPSFEAFLLRHLEGCETLRPPNSAIALQELKKRWPTYQKALSAMRLAERISQAEVERCASVEPQFRDLLTNIGFL